MAKFLSFRDRSFRDAADNPQSAAVPVRGKVFRSKLEQVGVWQPRNVVGWPKCLLGFLR